MQKILWEQKFKPKGIFGGHINIRSIVQKSEEIQQLLSDSNLDYLCLTETWLTPTTPLAMFNVPGFKIYRKDRQSGRGGGVMVYVKENIKTEELPLITDNLECIGIKMILSPEMHFNVIVVYRPPTAKDCFINSLSDILKQYSNKELIVMGDFNLDWLNKARRKKLKDIASSLHMTQMINSPTRITQSSRTLLDLIFTNKPDRITKTYNLLTGLSDHNMTLITRKLSKDRYKDTQSSRCMRFIPKKDRQVLENELKNVPWNDIVQWVNTNQSCDELMTKIKDIITKYTKTQTRKQGTKKKIPWINETIWNLMKKRDSALKRANKTCQNVDRMAFKSLRNKVTALLRKARADFHLEIIKAAKGNIGQLWKSIDKLTGRGQKRNEEITLNVNGTNITDSSEISNYFNLNFIQTVQTLNKNFTQTCDSEIIINNKNGLQLEVTSESKVNKVLSSLSSSQSKDIFGMDTLFIKTYKDILTPPITKLINQSIAENTFPNTLKTATIIPIHKAGNKQDINNYRPISILPVLSKPLEKVVTEQLTQHLEDEGLLHPMQFGFRANHSTETACCLLTETIKQSLDNGGVVGAIFLDLRKAFDTVSHHILLNKLAHLKLSTSTLSWLKSYLSGRTQCVRIDNTISEIAPTDIGLPQGSNIGPLLFSLYINDLPSVCQDVNIQMYADDTVVYTWGKDAEQVAKKLTLAMENVSKWLNASCLTLNIKKTATMYFVNNNKQSSFPNITVNGERIQNVKEYRYLGIMLDPHLTFKKHVKQMCHSIKYNIKTFKCIRNSLTLEAALTYFNSMIMSRFYYCITCWSQANKTTLRPLESLHKQSLKILDKKPRQYHHCTILQKYRMLNFNNIQKYASIRMTHKILNNTAPAPLKNFIKYTSAVSSRSTRASTTGQCNIPRLKTTFAQSAFSYKAIKDWNDLPSTLKTQTDYLTFSTELKKWLWNNQHCQHTLS